MTNVKTVSKRKPDCRMSHICMQVMKRLELNTGNISKNNHLLS